MSQSLELIEIACADCGIYIFMSTKMNEQKRTSHKHFYCLNGHSNYYPGDTVEDELRKKIALKESEILNLKDKLTKKKRK